MKLRQLDLFSGIGGFHLGFEKAGFEIESYFSEIDKYAIEVYKQNFKSSKYVGSVTNIQSKDLPKIDLITFGSPCQDFSMAGKRKGMQGNRSSLISEAIRLISECKPRIFIWENVKGTFSSNNGEDFWAIIQAFANIGGYRLEWQLLNTSWFLPQNRERVYLVGLLGEGSGKQIFPLTKSIKRNREKQFSRKATNKNKFSLQDIEDRGGCSLFQSGGLKVNSGVKQGYETAKPGDSVNLSHPRSETKRGRVGTQQSQTLDTGCNMAVVQPTQLGNSETFGNYSKDNGKDAFTIRSSNPNGVALDSKIRRLTPIECERLQGFPDDWTKNGVEGLISDSQRYKMCGNAVTVDVVESIANKYKTLYYE